MEQWLSDREHTIDTIVKALTVVIAIFGIYFAIDQLKQTKMAAVFTAEQIVYRESREILKMFIEDKDLLKNLNNSTISDSKLTAQIGSILNFYTSVLREGSAPFLGSNFHSSFIRDFCSISKFEQISSRLVGKKSTEPYFILTNTKREHCGG